MYLVNEQDRSLSIHPLQILRLCNDLLHVLFPGNRRINLGKLRTCRIRYDLCQRRFPGTGRSVKDDRADLVRPDGAVKQLVLAYDVLLPDHLVQRPRAHPRCKRRFLLHIRAAHIFKNIHAVFSLLLSVL